MTTVHAHLRKGKAVRQHLRHYFHAAPRSARYSILKHGLNPAYAKFGRSTGGSEVYLFEDLPTAKWYRDVMANTPPVERFDIWKVRASPTKLKADFGLDSSDEEGGGSWYSTTPFSRQHVRLVGAPPRRHPRGRLRVKRLLRKMGGLR